eukprot:gene248-423_t
MMTDEEIRYILLNEEQRLGRALTQEEKDQTINSVLSTHVARVFVPVGAQVIDRAANENDVEQPLFENENPQVEVQVEAREPFDERWAKFRDHMGGATVLSSDDFRDRPFNQNGGQNFVHDVEKVDGSVWNRAVEGKRDPIAADGTQVISGVSLEQIKEVFDMDPAMFASYILNKTANILDKTLWCLTDMAHVENFVDYWDENNVKQTADRGVGALAFIAVQGPAQAKNAARLYEVSRTDNELHILVRVIPLEATLVSKQFVTNTIWKFSTNEEGQVSFSADAWWAEFEKNYFSGVVKRMIPSTITKGFQGGTSSTMNLMRQRNGFRKFIKEVSTIEGPEEDEMPENWLLPLELPEENRRKLSRRERFFNYMLNIDEDMSSMAFGDFPYEELPMERPLVNFPLKWRADISTKKAFKYEVDDCIITGVTEYIKDGKERLKYVLRTPYGNKESKDKRLPAIDSDEVNLLWTTLAEAEQNFDDLIFNQFDPEFRGELKNEDAHTYARRAFEYNRLKKTLKQSVDKDARNWFAYEVRFKELVLKKRFLDFLGARDSHYKNFFDPLFRDMIEHMADVRKNLSVAPRTRISDPFFTSVSSMQEFHETNDTDRIRTCAGGAQWISSPPP